MKIDKVDHVGISVKNMDNTLKFFTENLGVKKSDIADMTIPGQIRLATIKLPGACLEFVQYLNDKEVLSKYADPRSDAIHHFAVYVDNLEETMRKIKNGDGTLIHETPMEIPGGIKVAFALPKASNVMIEFMEAAGGRR
jgi:methylmalonyl-CoA/ethylmalonyl-CoA epimerase